MGITICIIVTLLCWIGLFTWLGVERCKQDDYLGIVFLFLGLSFLGLLIGVCIICNNKNKQKGDK